LLLGFQDYGEETEGLNVIQEYVKSHWETIVLVENDIVMCKRIQSLFWFWKLYSWAHNFGLLTTLGVPLGSRVL
jgi:hypothetical protein